MRITKEGMEKLGDITIFVLDYDPAGADNLGFFRLGLDQVTHSAYQTHSAAGEATLTLTLTLTNDPNPNPNPNPDPNPGPGPHPNQVTNSTYRRLEREGIKTRVFEHDALPLAQPGMKATQGTMHLQAR